MSTAERLAREVKNSLCTDGTLNSVLEAVLLSKSPDTTMALLTGLAHEAVDRAYRSTPADGGGQGVTPLTDAEIKTVAERCPMKPWGIGSRWPDALAFARAIESAHRIGTPASTGGEGRG